MNRENISNINRLRFYHAIRGTLGIGELVWLLAI